MLADPHAIVRDGLRLALEATGRITVVVETGCTEEAVRISSRAKPDVLAIGLQGRGSRTLRAIRKLTAREPGTNVLVLTDPGHPGSLDGIIEAGARGCIGKNRTAGDLAMAHADLAPERAFVVYAGSERYPVAESVEVIGLAEMARILANPRTLKS